MSLSLPDFTLLAPADATAALQVFWPESGGYSATAVAGERYPVKRWTRVVLEVPPQDRGAVLRLDPCSNAGIVEIACIRVAPKGVRKAGMRIRRSEIAASLELDDLLVTPGSRVMSFVSLGADPKIFLPPMTDDLFGRRLRIEVLLRVDPSGEAALEKLRPLIAQLEHQRATEDRLAWLEDRWKAQVERCAELEQLEPALKRVQEELAGQGATAEFLRGELAHARKELDWARNEIERLRRDGERRKIAARAAERSFQFRWTLPSFLLKRRQTGIVQQTGFEFQIENPKAWNLAVHSATVSGWCFSKSGECIQSVRARIGDRVFDGLYGRRRFDVQSVFPNHGNSGHCGFEIEIADLPGRFELVLEALDGNDRWHTLATVPGKVAQSRLGLGRARSGEEGLALRNQIMRLAAADEKLFKKEIAKMAERPRISIIMPVYNTPADYLREAIQSVVAQVYPDWQLCIADDASTSEATRRVLKEAALRDPRIVVEWRKENGGIATASNTALNLAEGDIIALMDHDDLIAPVATLRLAQAVLGHAADLIYSDEGLLSPAGEFIGGAYRPAFSPAYLRSHPYIVHLVAFSARLIREIGGFTDGLRISQDYDLILRAAEKARSIVHIPEVLYLWRQLPASAGHSHQESVMEISSSILEGHLHRTNLPGAVGQGFGFNFFKTHRKLHLPDLSVAIIIPTKNQAALLRRCVESLERTLPPALPFRIVIVDHDSDEEDAVELLSELRRRHTVLPYSGSFNYSAINNLAVRQGAGDAQFLLFCNNDIEAVEPGWMETLLGAAADPAVGAVAPLLLYPDNETVQHAGVSVGIFGLAEHLGKFLPIRSPDGNPRPGYQGLLRVTREVAAVTTGCALVRRGAFEAIGGFNEEMQVGFNDTDLCLRLWQGGHRVLYCGETLLIHHESATRGKSFGNDPHPADSRRFRENWGWLIEKGDPFYNPNLRADSTSWETALVTKREPKPRLRRYCDPASLFRK
jgi:O-antigen biosynthesis protein